MKKLVFFGAGEMAKAWLEKIGEENVFCLADSNPDLIGTIRFGKEVKSIDELKVIREEIAIFISVSNKYKKEILNLLEMYELDKNIVLCPYGDEVVKVSKSSEYDYQTIFEGRNILFDNTNIQRCKLGYASYISNNSSMYLTKIGRYSCIGPNVHVIRGQHPTTNFVSIHPAFYSPENEGSSVCYVSNKLYEENRWAEDGYAVKIGNDVWIGHNVLLMEGVTVGDGAIIAAGAVVTKNVEPYSIVGGIPAKEIRKRFSNDDINYLLELQWWNKGENWIKENAKYFSDISFLRHNLG